MLNKCFSIGSVFALASVMVVWVGCGSDDTTSSNTTADAGTSSTGDASSNGTNTVDSGSSSNTGLDGGVPVTYGACADVQACGGDLVGDWKITGGCLSADTFAEAKTQCPGLQESNVVIQAAGTVDFTATNVTRDTTIALTGSVFIPLGGTCPATAPYNCGLLGIGLTSGAAPGGLAFDKATCTDATGTTKGCNCDVAKTIRDASTKTYTAANGVLTTTESPQETYNYCVAGNTTTYRETTQSQTLKLNVTIGK